MKKIQGAFGILATPFLPDGSVDYPQIRQMIRVLCQTSLHGIVVCGSTSESVMLSEAENKAIMKTAAEELRGEKLLLICGAASADVSTVRRYLQYACELGAAAALVPPPYYFTYSAKEVLEFYRSLQGEDSVPVIAYQIPAFTSDIPLESIPQLLAMPHVIGLKNSSANSKQLMHQIQLRDSVRPEFSILTGTDDALLPALAGGCDGSFTALGSILPEQVEKLYQAFDDGNWERAQALQKSLLPLLRLADSFPFPVGYKLLAQAAGCMTTAYRQALPEETILRIEEVKQQMQAALCLLEKE